MKPKREPWHPADWEPADVGAIKACIAGEARPDQQQRAMSWIINKAAMTYDQSFAGPGQSDVMAFIEGRRSVGNQIVKLSKIDLAALNKITEAKQKDT